MRTTGSNELALYDLLVFTGLKTTTPKEKEFAERLSFSMYKGFPLYQLKSEKDEVRQIGKSTFLARIAKTINSEKQNKALLVVSSSALKELSIKRCNDESLDIVTQHISIGTIENKNYTHIIFDEVSIPNYERIKEVNKDATLLGIIG